MARRIATTRTTRLVRCLGAALVAVLVGIAPARAQTAPGAAASVSKACTPGTTATANESPLPHVAAALAQRKTLRILAMGAAPGRVSARRGGYTAVIEAMVSHALEGFGVVMINRGVSGELAANAAIRMKNEVALEEPDLVLWQVGTNDALAYVSVDEFRATVKDQIDWLKAHNVDVVLVGLQFAKEMLRDAHYVDIRETLRQVAAQENVIVVRFFEAMQIEIEHSEAGYNCLAQYVARAITLGVFGKNIPSPPAPQQK
jgi:acyl-CoA thioesterase-1